jgi:bis(5'-adenosyl)-triphosphatase
MELFHVYIHAQFLLLQFSKIAHILIDPLEKYFGCTATTLTIQDGTAAGQTVDSVHLHIIPRKEGDLPDSDHFQQLVRTLNLFSYSRINIVQIEAPRINRSNEEMAEEAGKLRKLF